MEFQFDIGLVGPHAGTRQGLSAAIEHVVDQLAVEALRNRARHHRGQQPIDPDRRLGADLVERQPVEDREAHAAPQDPAQLGHRGAAGRHLEIIGPADDCRQREPPQLVRCPADFVETRAGQRNEIIIRAQVVATPGARARDS